MGNAGERSGLLLATDPAGCPVYWEAPKVLNWDGMAGPTDGCWNRSTGFTYCGWGGGTG